MLLIKELFPYTRFKDSGFFLSIDFSVERKKSMQHDFLLPLFKVAG